MCGRGQEIKNGELQDMSTLGFKEPCCDRQRNAIMDRVLPLLLMEQ
jgi:hypothetical protein